MAKLAEYQLGPKRANTLDLYELCVQSPERQARFLRAVHGGGDGGRSGMRVLGEDFSGPAGIARAWVRLDDEHEAVAVDREALPLEHAARRQREWDLRHDAPSSDRAGIDRLTLRTRDVLEAGDHADVIAALNFAVCELHTRARLMTYLRHLLFRLEAGGVFVADVYGGPDAFTAGTYERTVELPEEWGGGTMDYEWEQVSADAATARVRNAIHFVLPDGARIENAFVYDWRLWSTVELREAMLEAGFKRTEVYDAYADAMDAEGNPYPRAISTTLEEVDEEGSVDGPFVHYVAALV